LVDHHSIVPQVQGQEVVDLEDLQVAEAMACHLKVAHTREQDTGLAIAVGHPDTLVVFARDTDKVQEAHLPLEIVLVGLGVSFQVHHCYCKAD